MISENARVLITPRLVMRPASDGDLSELTALMADPEVAGRLYHGVLDAAAASALLEDYKASWRDRGYGMWALRKRDDGTFIGVCGLWHRDDGLGIATRIALARSAWGQDVAAEAGRAMLRYAFEVLQLPRLVSITRETNPNAERVLIRLGWRLEEKAEKNGRVLLRYAMTREEWQRHHGERTGPATGKSTAADRLT